MNAKTEDIDYLRATPIINSLGIISKQTKANFHSLPVSGFRSLEGSKYLECYQSLFGNFIKNEQTDTSARFDSLLHPKASIKKSREITARAFGADDSFYVTTGTTTSNYIVLSALLPKVKRILVDRRCHQSIHFAISPYLNCKVTYTKNLTTTDGSGRTALDIQNVLDELEKGVKNDNPFDVLILNGYSYEGVRYDLERLFTSCLEIQSNLTFVIDEAWFAFGAFHPLYRSCTAMGAANIIADRFPNRTFNVIATQSAHKSLNALRQASYIHVFGSDELIKNIHDSFYQIHTTSPNYPILASLELARTQAVSEGYKSVEKALKLAKIFTDAFSLIPQLDNYKINHSKDFVNEFTMVDPLKISIDVSKVTENPIAIKNYLFDKFGVYVNHSTDQAILINIHWGVTEKSIEHLLEGIRKFQEQANVSDEYIIPYPPGVPIVVPGDELTPQLKSDLKKIHEKGTPLYKKRISLKKEVVVDQLINVK